MPPTSGLHLKKPTRLQLRHQHRVLDSFGPLSEPLTVKGLVRDAGPLARTHWDGSDAAAGAVETWGKGLKKKDVAKLKEECRWASRPHVLELQVC